MDEFVVLGSEDLLRLALDRSYLFSFLLLTMLMGLAQIFNYLRCRSGNGTSTDQKVKVIIHSWWKIMAFCFFAFLFGKYSLIPSLFFLTLIAAKEYLNVSAMKEKAHILFPGFALGALIHYLSFYIESSFLFFTSFQLFILFLVIPILISNPDLERLPLLLSSLIALMILTIFLSFPAAVLVFESDWIGGDIPARLAVLLLIVLTELNDILQFTFGKLFGKRKLIAHISPNKTEAGFLGGILGSTIVGALLWPIFLPVDWRLAGAMSFLLSLGGILGDLVCSAIKRHRQVKDFSDLIPGHGGVLDRLDSLLVTAPIFFFCLYLFSKGGSP